VVLRISIVQRVSGCTVLPLAELKHSSYGQWHQV
jgi:hypothetical protein